MIDDKRIEEILKGGNEFLSESKRFIDNTIAWTTSLKDITEEDIEEFSRKDSRIMDLEVKLGVAIDKLKTLIT